MILNYFKISIHLHNKHVFIGSLAGWLVGDYFLLTDFKPYVILFMKVCIIITVAIVILLRDFGTCGIIFVILCLLL
jgi:hypothetical protein